MKKLIIGLCLLAVVVWGATPNVPLYVTWDGYIAAPTQFLNRVFTAGTNVTLVDNRTNLTISASLGYIANDLATSNGIIAYVDSLTNSSITIATNATSKTIDFSSRVWYEVTTLMTTNLVLSPTNLIDGQERWIYFTASNGNFDVSVTNSAGTAVRWNLNSATNGSTSFTVTNGQRAELSIFCRSNNILHAVYGHYR